MIRKKIVFLTWTRADFWKIKSLIEILTIDKDFEVYIFATGMHLNPKYGKTINEIYKCGFKNIFPFFNHRDGDSMELVLSKTISWFSDYVNDIQPDMVIVHWDRSEALAGAIVWSFNNILVWHIEWWEISGTIDELIRHSVSKMAHLHFVSHQEARENLIQMGEEPSNIFVIGSPDIDIMKKAIKLNIEDIKKYYNISFSEYAIAMFHPVTTEYDTFHEQAKNFVDALLASKDNYIVIYPNNDKGAEFIFEEYKRLENRENILLFPSLRFEYFLKLLSNAKYMIWNSSAGIREAPFYWISSIDIGTRQSNRYEKWNSIIHSEYDKYTILESIKKISNVSVKGREDYWRGESDKLFFDILKNKNIFSLSKQKRFLKI